MGKGRSTELDPSLEMPVKGPRWDVGAPARGAHKSQSPNPLPGNSQEVDLIHLSQLGKARPREAAA